MKTITILLALSLSLSVFSQKVKIFKTPDGQVWNEVIFKTVTTNDSFTNDFQAIITDSIQRNDSIFYQVSFKPIENKTANTPKKTSRNPFAKFEKLKGKRFEIEKFKNFKGKNFKKKSLKGKPTIINFWFIKCPPCISEMPELNTIKNTYGDKMNYYAITFDSKELVDEFLTQKDFNFTHITDSREQIDKLGVSTFPFILLLDKTGKVIFYDGDYRFLKQEIEKLLE